ncbi:hypothetical protein GCM10009430_32760 [Aquimarina litoralis]|uniref:DUF4268 domain-containing protein n=1 Tax=Aquimarina litoralis TaxID=584605 RepID=A0ABP3UCT2_9FLAO
MYDNKLPRFLISQIGVKKGTYQDYRKWVTCTLYSSVAEFICLDYVGAFSTTNINMTFYFKRETWIGSLTVNNCDIYEMDPLKLLEEAWDYYSNYLEWLDTQINSFDKTISN